MGPTQPKEEARAMSPKKPDSPMFEIERQNDTVIVVPSVDLREFEYEGIESGAKEIMNLLERGGARNVVMDFHKTDYYGSTALGFFVKLWRRVVRANGRMVFCNISAHEREILRVTRLDSLWPICASRQQALQAVTA
jgi:anti-anti-sigma factor